MFGIYSANINDEDFQTSLLPVSMLFSSVLFHVWFSKKQGIWCSMAKCGYSVWEITSGKIYWIFHCLRLSNTHILYNIFSMIVIASLKQIAFLPEVDFYLVAYSFRTGAVCILKCRYELLTNDLLTLTGVCSFMHF